MAKEEPSRDSRRGQGGSSLYWNLPAAAGLPPTSLVWFLLGPVRLGLFGADEQNGRFEALCQVPEASEMGSRGIDWSASALGEGSLRAGSRTW